MQTLLRQMHERAAMFVLDQIEFPCIFWGSPKAGMLPVALNTLLSTAIYRAILDDRRAAIAFVCGELLEVVLPTVKDSPHVRSIVVIGGDAPAGPISWQDVLHHATPLPAIAVSGDEIAFWLYSSGSTEMLHFFLSNGPGDIDEGAADVGEGAIGELLVRGESATADYWNQRRKTRASFEGEWTRTGDKYELSKSGRLIYCGRTDDMFKVSGIWVSPFEIEQTLMMHPPCWKRRSSPMRTRTRRRSPRRSSCSRTPETPQRWMA